jgi:type IX secretion system PorP/SprF family membrane protein
MSFRSVFILIFLFSKFLIANCQESAYGPGYQTILVNNPAFAGSESDGILRLSYLNFYPGNNYNLHSVFVSYDTYMPLLHGGAGFFVADDYLGGVVNDVRGGCSYSYHLQANKNLFINAGLCASFYHRGFNRGSIILPDQIDPLNGAVYPSGENIVNRGRTVLDLGAGFLLIAGKFLGGFSLSHLTQPDLGGISNSEDRIKRKLDINISYAFDAGKKRQLLMMPVLFGEIQGDRITAGTGGLVGSDVIAFNSILLVSSAKDIDLQAGFSVRKGIMLLFYNYCFNIKSENTLMPVSLLHQAGLAVSLHNVDKRKVIKTINLPKL